MYILHVYVCVFYFFFYVFLGVGKTCLVTKYIKNTLHKDVGPTIAASFFTCKVILEDVKVKLQVSTTNTNNKRKKRRKKKSHLDYQNTFFSSLYFLFH